jgi:hypothetical protein
MKLILNFGDFGGVAAVEDNVEVLGGELVDEA